MTIGRAKRKIARLHPPRSGQPIILPVTKERQVAHARQQAMILGRINGFRNILVHAFATMVSELAYNLIFHTEQGGTMTLNHIVDGIRQGLEVVSEDRGPGIADIDLALQDGFSTAGGLGGGLPGVRRLADDFEIQSKIGVGTRIVARKWEKRL